MNDMTKRYLNRMFNPRPTPLEERIRVLEARITELELENARLKLEAKALEDLL